MTNWILRQIEEHERLRDAMLIVIGIVIGAWIGR